MPSFFGHDGERYLFELCLEYGLTPFIYSIQSVHFLRQIERKGRGMNLSCQMLDGIMCHDGEKYLNSLKLLRKKKDFAFKIAAKLSNPGIDLSPPMILESCVVKMFDVISYVGRDIENAVRINLIVKGQIPEKCSDVLGDTNRTI